MQAIAVLRCGARPTMERPVALPGGRPLSYRHWSFGCGRAPGTGPVLRDAAGGRAPPARDAEGQPGADLLL